MGKISTYICVECGKKVSFLESEIVYENCKQCRGKLIPIETYNSIIKKYNQQNAQSKSVKNNQSQKSLQTSSKSNEDKKNIKVGIIGTIIIVAIIIVLCNGGSSKSSKNVSSGSQSSKASGSVSSGSQRCYYCGKVIFSDGRPIHATHEYLDTYSCDYCGTKNVKN